MAGSSHDEIMAASSQGAARQGCCAAASAAASCLHSSSTKRLPKAAAPGDAFGTAPRKLRNGLFVRGEIRGYRLKKFNPIRTVLIQNG